ncbi:MAG: branched-chain amino acid ABC transporter permease [Hyphomicrobiales bacterium]|nr:MAG: branched-chain amino acid ABC transporter permease [Hyphomicrobiales bacterium]
MFELQIYVVSALVSAAIWTLPAASISLIYGVLRYPSFAITEFMTLGAYLALFLSGFSLPLWAAAILAATLTGAIALGFDQTFFRSVRRAGALPPVLLSLGLMLFLQNLVRFVWGNNVLQLPIPMARPYSLAGFIITPSQMVIIVSVVAILTLSIIALRRTSFGRAIRAMASNPELAVVTGVPQELIYGGVIFIAGFLAAIGGVALATETTLTPLLGWRVLIPLFAVAILGGLGSIVGAAYAALLLGFVSEFSLMVLPPTYKSALAFLVLAIVLIVKPTGLVRTGD